MGDCICTDCCEGALLCLPPLEKEFDDRCEPFAEDKDDVLSASGGNGTVRVGIIVAMLLCLR